MAQRRTARHAAARSWRGRLCLKEGYCGCSTVVLRAALLGLDAGVGSSADADRVPSTRGIDRRESCALPRLPGLKSTRGGQDHAASTPCLRRHRLGHRHHAEPGDVIQAAWAGLCFNRGGAGQGMEVLRLTMAKPLAETRPPRDTPLLTFDQSGPLASWQVSK